MQVLTQLIFIDVTLPFVYYGVAFANSFLARFYYIGRDLILGENHRKKVLFTIKRINQCEQKRIILLEELNKKGLSTFRKESLKKMMPGGWE